MPHIAARWPLAFTLTMLFAPGPPGGRSTSNVLEKSFAFPSPVQWKAEEAEISLIGLAWGPAQSPEMLAKGREKTALDKPQFFADRPYVLALHFQATLPNVVATEQYFSSGLTLVKSVDGDLEIPWQLTPSGFTPFSGSPGVYDIRFNRGKVAEFWDVFAVSPDQKEFLFQVPDSVRMGTGAAVQSFRVVLRDGGFVVVNTGPQALTCSKLNKSFVGVIGASSRLSLRLKREGEAISGTEQYARIGETLWLQGTADSLGNFAIEERYPKDHVTGIFKGKFSPDCRMLTGYFSKPDGSRLQPFELRDVGSTDRSESSSEPEQNSEQK